MTQVELAAAVGRTQSTVARWESGRGLSVDDLHVVARAIGVAAHSPLLDAYLLEQSLQRDGVALSAAADRKQRASVLRRVRREAELFVDIECKLRSAAGDAGAAENVYDEAFERFDDWFEAGNFDAANAALEAADVMLMGTDEIIAVLSVTVSAHDKLPARQGFQERCREQLVRLVQISGAERVERLLAGLEVPPHVAVEPERFTSR